VEVVPVQGVEGGGFTIGKNHGKKHIANRRKKPSEVKVGSREKVKDLVFWPKIASYFCTH